MLELVLQVKNKIKLWLRHRALIKQGVLIPITSFAHYSKLVKDAKTSCAAKLFTNCYLLPAEIKRLISLGNFYLVATTTGLVFVDDEGGYYYMFLFVDLTQNLTLPRLEKNILVEDVYYEGRQTANQEQFEKLIQTAGCKYLNTYKAVTARSQLSPEKFWKKFEIIEKTLAAEHKSITQPTNRQLKAFEKIYRETINPYVQKRYSRRERKTQRDLGYLHCIADEAGNLYAIQISGNLHGGAIATRKDCQGGIYSPALMLHSYKEYYAQMPKELEEQKKYMRSRSLGGWIAIDNAPSWRMHKMLGITTVGKSMNQFVLPTQRQ